jgi:type IV secretory pathway protease TraF
MRGTIVAVSVPWWNPALLPLLKPVATVEGDRVCRARSTLWILGHRDGEFHRKA